MRPEQDVLDAIAELERDEISALVDTSLSRPITDSYGAPWHDTSGEVVCPLCEREWHGLAESGCPGPWASEIEKSIFLALKEEKQRQDSRAVTIPHIVPVSVPNFCLAGDTSLSIHHANPYPMTYPMRIHNNGAVSLLASSSLRDLPAPLLVPPYGLPPLTRRGFEIVTGGSPEIMEIYDELHPVPVGNFLTTRLRPISEEE